MGDSLISASPVQRVLTRRPGRLAACRTWKGAATRHVRRTRPPDPSSGPVLRSPAEGGALRRVEPCGGWRPPECGRGAGHRRDAGRRSADAGGHWRSTRAGHRPRAPRAPRAEEQLLLRPPARRRLPALGVGPVAPVSRSRARLFSRLFRCRGSRPAGCDSRRYPPRPLVVDYVTRIDDHAPVDAAFAAAGFAKVATYRRMSNSRLPVTPGGVAHRARARAPKPTPCSRSSASISTPASIGLPSADEFADWVRDERVLVIATARRSTATPPINSAGGAPTGTISPRERAAIAPWRSSSSLISLPRWRPTV